MITRFSGNRLTFIMQGNETDTNIRITLPDGYSIHQMLITSGTELTLADGSHTNPTALPSNIPIMFPIVNSKSPNTFILRINTLSQGIALTINIFKFGCIPDSSYFDKEFEPILIKTKDDNGNEIEYNMIPTTQFER